MPPPPSPLFTCCLLYVPHYGKASRYWSVVVNRSQFTRTSSWYNKHHPLPLSDALTPAAAEIDRHDTWEMHDVRKVQISSVRSPFVFSNDRQNPQHFPCYLNRTTTQEKAHGSLGDKEWPTIYLLWMTLHCTAWLLGGQIPPQNPLITCAEGCTIMQGQGGVNSARESRSLGHFWGNQIQRPAPERLASERRFHNVPTPHSLVPKRSPPHIVWWPIGLIVN